MISTFDNKNVLESKRTLLGNSLRIVPFVATAALFAPSIGRAGVSDSTIEPALPESPGIEDRSVFDDLWSFATLYKNDNNEFIQEFKLRGRYQGQYHWLDSDQGDDDGWEDRRSRLGFDAKLFNRKIEVRADFESNDGFEEAYASLVDAFVKWKPSSDFSLTLGRQKPQIGYYDWLQSTNSQPTFERSQIFNQMRVNRLTGAVAEGNIDRWNWSAGVYSNDIDKEFGGFDGGVSYGAGIGYDLKETLGLESADWRLHWLHSDSEPTDTLLNRYSDIVSMTFYLQDDRWSFVTEAFYGSGVAPDVFGIFVQPTYDLISDRLQLVGRYTYSVGDGPDSVTAQSRYERAAPDITGGGRGESYHALYLGAQYFIYGDKLKFLAGVEYADLDGGGNGGDFDGTTFLAGIRFSF